MGGKVGQRQMPLAFKGKISQGSSLPLSNFLFVLNAKIEKKNVMKTTLI
jgi:hypothetical protein